MTGLAAVLETLSAHYMFDADGRIRASRCDGVPPRFVLGRAAEGCVWRLRADLAPADTVVLARWAAREPGARFDGDLPAPPERLGSIRRLLARGEGVGEAETGRVLVETRRMPITRDGVVVGEIWTLD